MSAKEPNVTAQCHYPTAHLRFVERGVPAPELGPNIGRNVKILQQLWLPFDPSQDKEKWIDVPLVDS